MRKNAREPKLVRYRGSFAVQHYDEAGLRRRTALGTSDRARAEAAFIAWKRQASASVAGGGLTVGQIYTAYVADRKAEGKPATVRMDDAWKRLKETFGPLAVSDVTPDLCRQYREKRSRKAKDGTIHVELGYLRAALVFARRSGWIAHAPDVPLPQKPRPVRGHLTREEARKLVEAAALPHVCLFIRLAIATAGRASAILDLTWDRVDFVRGRIMLRDPERQTTPKGRATVPMNDMIRAALEEAKEGATGDYVVEWGGQRIASIKKAVAAAAKRAGIVCTPHVLRHTAAVWMVENGVPMGEVSQYLGHTSTAVTESTYARYSPTHLRTAAKALEF